MNSKRTLEGAITLLLLFSFLPITTDNVSTFQEQPIPTGNQTKMKLKACQVSDVHKPLEIRSRWDWKALFT